MRTIVLILLLGMAIYDYKYKLVNSAFCMVILLLGLSQNTYLIDALLGVSLIPLSLLVINIFKNEAIGAGDIELFAALGFFVGYRQITVIFFIACLLALIYSFFIKKKELPLVPFIFLAYTFTLFHSYLPLFSSSMDLVVNIVNFFI